MHVGVKSFLWISVRTSFSDAFGHHKLFSLPIQFCFVNAVLKNVAIVMTFDALKPEDRCRVMKMIDAVMKMTDAVMKMEIVILRQEYRLS